MADSAAERQRRSRAHKRGDHSLCPPDRADCGTVTVVTRDTGDGRVRPYGLRTRGRRMWDQIVADTDPIEVVVLVEEICRLADRLDRLDAIVNGRDRAWLTLEIDDAGDVTVIVDKVLTEARQQQTTLKALLSELRQARAGRTQPQGKQEASRRDELAKRREERRRAAGL